MTRLRTTPGGAHRPVVHTHSPTAPPRGRTQALKQQPISFNRQVLALLAHPTMLEWPEVVARFPPDVIRRAKEYLDAIPQGIGAYSESQGFAIVRQQVADFISARDGVPADPKDIFLTDGASKGVQTILKAVLSSAKDGVLVPIPQYPLYSASLVLDGAQMIGYYLSETNGWNMPIEVHKLQATFATCHPCRPHRPPAQAPVRRVATL